MLSLWKTLRFKLRKGTSPEAGREMIGLAQNALNLAKDGLEHHYIDGPEAEAAMKLATAASTVIASLAGVEDAVLRIGPLLLVKCTQNGVCRIAAQTISPKLRRLLDENPRMLQSSEVLFAMLAEEKEPSEY